MSADESKTGHIPVCEANAQVAIDNGAEFVFSIFTRYLEKDDDRVTGAIAQRQSNEYVRYNASKGILMCCDDMSGNRAMMDYYCPQAADYVSQYNTVDCNNAKANTGDGHLMGMWAGAVMEDGPLAPMTHNVSNRLPGHRSRPAQATSRSPRPNGCPSTSEAVGRHDSP